MRTSKTSGFQFAATDLSNHLSCAHLTQLQRRYALKEITKPEWNDPSLDVLIARGQEHEADYVSYLTKQGLKTIDLRDKPFEATLEAMKKGVDVIVQARLEDGAWMGFADILTKVPVASNLGNWSYEVQDTKLAQDTRPGSLLQLCLYAEILESIQGVAPEHIHIVKPGDPFSIESYRFDDFRAYFNLLKKDFVDAVQQTPPTYPDPVDHCNVCAWWTVCNQQRRADDHLSFVAGIRSTQIEELAKQDILTLEKFGRTEHLRKPERGHLESLKDKQKQAAIQLKGRETKARLHEVLHPQEEDRGFNTLPLPSDGDVYLDFEGDAFYPDGGLEYLTGWYYKEDNEWFYQGHWARNRTEEKAAFIKLMKFLMKRWRKHPMMCVYHFAPYEPTALKRLAHTHAVYEQELDKLLRGLRLVDLHAVVKGALIASVERYSLKDLEPFAGFTREVDLREAGIARSHIECALEMNDAASITPDSVTKVEGYNREDCIATRFLHEWLEVLRTKAEKEGTAFTRLELNDGEAGEEQQEAATRAEELRQAIIAQLPEDRESWSPEHQALWLLAHQVDYFQREMKTAWWEYFAIREMDNEELLDNRKAITGLTGRTVLPLSGRQQVPVVRYRFPPQDSDLRAGDKVTEVGGDATWTVVSVSLDSCTIDIKKSRDTINTSPIAIQVKPESIHGILSASLTKIAEVVRQHGLGPAFPYRAAKDLLLKSPPRLRGQNGGNLLGENEDHIDGAIRLAAKLDDSVLAIQGAPGSGKTYTGAMMIIQLAKQGKRIGVTAVSHKAIRTLLAKLKSEAKKQKVKVTVVHKADDSHDEEDGVLSIDNNTEALETLDNGAVVGGTAWLWSRDDAEGKLDYLFIDEAGQMSLTHVLAACRCARNLILLGDPQQLEQPQKGSHPEGSDVAALMHLLDGRKTISDDKGIFIKTTRRLHPSICQLTSELYYEGRLRPIDGLDLQAINGKTKFSGSGLVYVPVEHKGNQSKSTEEVSVVKQIIEDLMQNGTCTLINNETKKYETRRIDKEDILIVTPYNAQIAALRELLPDYRIGTVDKFQGQEAPVVIYTMASSSASDAPRGMSFLYSPNRFNVATSRAMCICILVASPKLFEPECRSIEQMRWANAMCRYKELAKTINPASPMN